MNYSVHTLQVALSHMPDVLPQSARNMSDTVIQPALSVITCIQSDDIVVTVQQFGGQQASEIALCSSNQNPH